MSQKKKIAILFGGVSSEHNVSLLSATSVIENISKEKYDLIIIGITKDGRWFNYTGSTEKIASGEWINDDNLTPAIISPDTSHHGILLLKETGVEIIKIDAVFGVLHGKNGEDGTMQGLLQLADIAFVGCDCVSSGVCMDKAFTNTVADCAKIPQAKWLGTNTYEYANNKEEILDNAEKYLGYPIFTKPANAGSSVGISKAQNRDELNESILRAFAHDKKVVLEEFIDGSEVECAVLGNDDITASVVGEIVPCNDFYDFDAKYLAGTSELHIPAKVSEEKQEEIRKAACKTYSALGCSGLSRVDFFVRKSDGKVMFNEINTIPGFTSISMYPKLFKASGIEYKQLLDTLINLAIEKQCTKTERTVFADEN